MLLLDTDHMSLLQRADSIEGKHILARLRAANQPVVTSIITFEEQVRGWLAQISKAKSATQLLQAYSRLSLLLHDYRSVAVTRMQKLNFVDSARGNSVWALWTCGSLPSPNRAARHC